MENHWLIIIFIITHLYLEPTNANGYGLLCTRMYSGGWCTRGYLLGICAAIPSFMLLTRDIPSSILQGVAGRTDYLTGVDDGCKHWSAFKKIWSLQGLSRWMWVACNDESE